MYVLSGRADYYYRRTESGDPLKKITLDQGDLIFTPPAEDHATVFLEDTTLLVLSRTPRDQDSYEADVERVALIDAPTLRPV